MVTGDHDTISTCARQCRKYFAKPLLLGFYFFRNDNFLKESGCEYKKLGQQFPDYFKRRPYV